MRATLLKPPLKPVFKPLAIATFALLLTAGACSDDTAAGPKNDAAPTDDLGLATSDTGDEHSTDAVETADGGTFDVTNSNADAANPDASNTNTDDANTGDSSDDPDAAPTDAGPIDPGTDRFVLSIGGAFNDEAKSVAIAKGGDLWIAGYTQSVGAGDWDGLLIRASSCGEVKWAKAYGGAGKDDVFAVAPTSDGGALLVGSTKSFGGHVDAWLVKTSENGDVQWSNTYGGGGHDAAHAVTVTDDSIAVVAETYNYGPGTPTNHNMMLFRTDPSGKPLWDKTFGGQPEGDAGFRIEALGQGGKTTGYLIGGATESFALGKDDVWLMRLSADGDHKWSKAIGGPGDDELRGLAHTPDGGFIVTGFTRSFAAYKSDAFLLKTDGQGNLMWFRYYGGANEERGYGVHPSPTGFVVTGHTSSFGLGYEDGFIAGFDLTGTPLWWRNLGGKGGDQALSSVAVTGSSDHHYFLAGRTALGGQQRNVLLMRADASGNTGCSMQHMPTTQLKQSSGAPTVKTFTPQMATGMGTKKASPTVTVVPKIPAWPKIVCQTGDCSP